MATQNGTNTAPTTNFVGPTFAQRGSCRLHVGQCGPNAPCYLGGSGNVCAAQSHCLNQYLLVIKEGQWQSPEGICTRDTLAINYWLKLENYSSKIPFKSPGGQRIKPETLFITALLSNWIILLSILHQLISGMSDNEIMLFPWMQYISRMPFFVHGILEAK